VLTHAGGRLKYSGIAPVNSKIRSPIWIISEWGSHLFLAKGWRLGWAPAFWRDGFGSQFAWTDVFRPDALVRQTSRDQSSALRLGLWIVDDRVRQMNSRYDGVNFFLALRVGLVKYLGFYRASVKSRVPGPKDITWIATRRVILALQDSSNRKTFRRL
jgi:hypothetical protein